MHRKSGQLSSIISIQAEQISTDTMLNSNDNMLFLHVSEKATIIHLAVDIWVQHALVALKYFASVGTCNFLLRYNINAFKCSFYVVWS